MEAALVEKITRLVLEKIEENHHQNEFSEDSALTKEELRRWHEISRSFQQSNAANTSFNESLLPSPLTKAEVKRWKQLSLSLRKGTDGESDSVTFFRHNRST